MDLTFVVCRIWRSWFVCGGLVLLFLRGWVGSVAFCLLMFVFVGLVWFEFCCLWLLCVWLVASGWFCWVFFRFDGGCVDCYVVVCVGLVCVSCSFNLCDVSVLFWLVGLCAFCLFGCLLDFGFLVLVV